MNGFAIKTVDGDILFMSSSLEELELMFDPDQVGERVKLVQINNYSDKELVGSRSANSLKDALSQKTGL